MEESGRLEIVMKSLITGSEGQLGTALKDVLDDPIGLDKQDADLTADITEESVIHKIREERPEVIVHAAAFVEVDRADENPEEAKIVNIDGTKNIIKAAESIGAHIIFISTDSVFDGQKGYYREDEETNPVNTYAKTKRRAEKIVEDSSCPSTILRTSLLFDGKNDNFFTWAKTQLEENGEIHIATDQICNPTYVGNLADIIQEAAKNTITGTFHAAGASIVSRYEAVQIMKEELNITGDIKKTTLKELPFKAIRPPNSSLCLSKLREQFNTSPQTLAGSINDAFR